MKLSWGFQVGIAVSLAIHMGFILLVPSPESDAVVRKPIHVVELRKLEIPLPDFPLPPNREAQGTLGFGPPPTLPQPKAPESLPKGLSPRDMSITSRIPDVGVTLPSPLEFKVIEERGKREVVPFGRFGKGDIPKWKNFGSNLLRSANLHLGVSPARIDQTDLTRLLRSRLIKKELRKSASMRNAGAKILGPVADRTIIFRPPPPRFYRDAQGEIDLQFWVLPDGTVGRVVLLVRGPLVLETASMQNIKRWKFNPIHVDTKAIDQWGTIRFRFLSPAAKLGTVLHRTRPPGFQKE